MIDAWRRMPPQALRWHPVACGNLFRRRAVLLPPALTITAQVLLGVLVGALGVMLAAPLTAAALVIIKMLYVEETLGDEVETPDDHLGAKDLPSVPR